MLAHRGSTRSTGWKFDQMVASVAPPRLTTRAPGKASRTRSGSERGIQSPERKTRRNAGVPAAAAAGKSGAMFCSAAGAESQKVIPSRQRMPTSASGSFASSAEAMRTAPPAARVPKRS